MALVTEPPQPPPAPPEADHPPWHWWTALALLLIYLIGFSTIAGVIGVLAGWDEPPDRFLIGATLVADVLLVALAYGVANASGPRARFHLGLRRTSPGRGLLWAAATMVGFFVLFVVWMAVLGVDESDDLAQDLGADRSSVNLVAVALLVCLVAPIAEEIFFRGFIYGALRRPIGWFGAAVVSGVVFGLVHAGGTEAVFLVPLAALGFLLCWLYRKTGSLIPCMAAHAFNNALALGVTLEWSAAATVGLIVAAPLVVVLLVSSVSLPAHGGAEAPPPLPPASAPTVWLPPVPPR